MIEQTGWVEQELILTLMEYKNQTKLQELFDKGEIIYFAVGIVRNMACSSTSAYHRKIRGFSANTYSIDSQFAGVSNKPE